MAGGSFGLYNIRASGSLPGGSFKGPCDRSPKGIQSQMVPSLTGSFQGGF